VKSGNQAGRAEKGKRGIAVKRRKKKPSLKGKKVIKKAIKGIGPL